MKDKTAGSTWRCWFQPESINVGPIGGGANELRPWVQGCPDPTITIAADDVVYTSSGSGNMQSLVLQDFKDLVDNNPALWNDSHPDHPSGGCATIDGGDGPCLGSENPRIRFIPAIKTNQVTGTGGGVNAPVEDVICVFVDKVASDMSQPHGQLPQPAPWNVYLRLTDTCAGYVGWD